MLGNRKEPENLKMKSEKDCNKIGQSRRWPDFKAPGVRTKLILGLFLLIQQFPSSIGI